MFKPDKKARDLKRFLGYFLELDQVSQIGAAKLLGIDTNLNDEGDSMLPIIGRCIIEFEELSSQRRKKILKIMREAAKSAK